MTVHEHGVTLAIHSTVHDADRGVPRPRARNDESSSAVVASPRPGARRRYRPADGTGSGMGRWQVWLGDRLFEQVVEMMAFRQVWDVFFDIFEKAPEVVHEDSTFLLWFRLAYARSQAMGIRRMTDMRADVVSLARLIARVRQRPRILTRDRYHAAQPIRGDDLRDWANAWFDRLAGSGDHIEKQVAINDLAALLTKTAPVRTGVNESVAHLKKGRPVEGPPLQGRP